MRLVLIALVASASIGTAFAQTAPNAPPIPIQEGVAVVGEDGSVAPAEMTNAGRPDPDAEVICRVVQEAGTRLARRRQRVCGTRTMWESLQDETARSIRNRGSGPTIQGAPGGA